MISGYRSLQGSAAHKVKIVDSTSTYILCSLALKAYKSSDWQSSSSNMARKTSRIILMLTLTTAASFMLQCSGESGTHPHTTAAGPSRLLHTNSSYLQESEDAVTPSRCPPWYIHHPTGSDTNTTVECSTSTVTIRECFKAGQLPEELQCSNTEGAKVEYGHCITYNDAQREFQFGSCHYFHVVEEHNVTERGYIILPDNMSELNHYMCGLIHRKGPLCSECEEGYGLTLSYTCSNCSGVWYGTPLYLAVQLVPVTILYFVILAFQINLTSAPITCFILYSQIIVFELQYDRRHPVGSLLYQICGTKLDILKTIYGVMNLEGIRFIVPPFCVNSRLELVHMTVLEYLPAFYPLLLILLTWLCIELHGHNFRPLVWAWKPFHKCFVRLRRRWNTKSDLVDVFSSFFLLSYSKILYLSLLLVNCIPRYVFTGGELSLVSTTYYNPGQKCNSGNHIGLAIFAAAVIVIFNVLPVLLLVLYPFKVFRSCLSRCKLNVVAIETFVNKFHGCYRDGLQGGRDMRMLVGLYFFMRIFIIVVRYVSPFLLPNIWLSYTVLYSTTTLLVAYSKPYKRPYMNAFDVVILANLSLLGVVVSAEYFKTWAIEVCIVIFLPVALLILFLSTRLFSSYRNMMTTSCKRVMIRKKRQTSQSQDINGCVSDSEDGMQQSTVVSSTTVSLYDDERESKSLQTTYQCKVHV